MGLKETNAALLAENAEHKRRIAALEDWKNGLPRWAAATGNYPTLEALGRYGKYREELRQKASKAAHNRTLETEGQGDIT